MKGHKLWGVRSLGRKQKARQQLPTGFFCQKKSGRRDLNARHSRWQRDALPLSYARRCIKTHHHIGPPITVKWFLTRP